MLLSFAPGRLSEKNVFMLSSGKSRILGLGYLSQRFFAPTRQV